MYGIIVTARQERYSVYGEVYGSFAVATDVVYVMNMVEILLDFIRAERDGTWTLHLEAFAATLP